MIITTMCIYRGVHIHTCMYIYIYIHTYIHTYICVGVPGAGAAGPLHEDLPSAAPATGDQLLCYTILY